MTCHHQHSSAHICSKSACKATTVMAWRIPSMRVMQDSDMGWHIYGGSTAAYTAPLQACQHCGPHGHHLHHLLHCGPHGHHLHHLLHCGPHGHHLHHLLHCACCSQAWHHTSSCLQLGHHTLLSPLAHCLPANAATNRGQQCCICF